MSFWHKRPIVYCNIVMFCAFRGWFFSCLNRRYLWLKWWTMMNIILPPLYASREGDWGGESKKMIHKTGHGSIRQFCFFSSSFLSDLCELCGYLFKKTMTCHRAHRGHRGKISKPQITMFRPESKKWKNYSTGLTAIRLSLINNLVNHVRKKSLLFIY